MFWRKRVYLDYASAAPVTREAWRAFTRATSAFGNPASPHEEGRRARDILEAARTQIARLVEAKPDDVIFTSGATEANNLAIRGLVRPGSHVLYLPSSHASVVESVRSLEGVITEPVPIENGRIDVDALLKLIRPATALISLDAVCGETGTLWNTREVANAIKRYADMPSARSAPAARPILHLAKSMPAPLLHVDASQAPLSQKITRSHFGADLLTLDAQKVGGVRGIGCLIAPRTIPLAPIMFGGAQERALRSGTPAPALAAAFAEALTGAVATRESFVKRATTLREQLSTKILKTIPDVYINAGADVVPNILNLSLPARDTDYLVTLLDTAGFAVSTRSACETDSSEGSRAVFVLTRARERALSTLRISWGPMTHDRELERFSDTLITTVAFLDKATPKSHY